MPHEETVETPEFRIPPFYERFQEERDKRFSSEISRLEAEIRHNGESIEDLKVAVASLRDELRSESANLRREMQNQFRWMMSLLLPIILGVVALLIQNLFHP
jgi:predicted RNase H-like nuclease (RuvC/YqgF family)